MRKSKCFGMQSLTWKAENLFGTRNMGGQFAAPPVCLIADQGVSDVAHVDPDLMRPPGFKTTLHFGRSRSEPVQHRNPCHCMASAFEPDCLPLAVRFVPRKLRRYFHDAATFETDPPYTLQPRIAHIGDTMTECSVGSFSRMRCKLFGKAMMRCIRLGDDQNTGRVFVDPVYDTRTFFTSDTGQCAAEMMQKRIDQGAGGRSGGRVHNHSRRLVHNDQIVILEENGQRNVFWSGFHIHGVFDDDLENVAFCNLRPRVKNDLTVPHHGAVLQQTRQA